MFWMTRALAEATRGRGWVEPNPLVGAVLVRDGQPVGIGHHARYGGPHAEVEALNAAGDRAKGASLYVNLEPCCHHGKTPPCTLAVVAAGVTRVVSAMSDPFSRVNGSGFAELRRAGIDVQHGECEAEARRLNAPYLKRITTGRPFVIAKWATTLDGKMATATGDSRWISNERSRAVVHEIRGRVDAIIVGIGTALADDPELTARPPGPRTAARVILDTRCRLPLTSRLAASARSKPVIVAVSKLAPEEKIAALTSAGCEVVRYDCDGPIPVVALLDDLGRRGMTNVLVEGGGTVIGSFVDAHEVDAVEVFVAPKIEGGLPAFTPAQGRGADRMADALGLIHVETASLDADVWIRGMVDRPWLAPVASIHPA
jgi:diaminohydroxyphosphoribosylaminopyrimidine deaminase / 5-amino-6-(5-phosphoribosylamino)uracil reductase